LAQLSQGKFDEAREILEKLKANNLKNKKNRHALPKIILDSSNLSVTLISMGEIESGIIEAESALLQCSALGETDRIIRVFPLVNLALANLELGRIDEGGKIALEAEKEFLEAKKLPIWLMQSSFDQAKAINLLNLAKWAFMVEKTKGP
jgi:tetratricopeptide (TPR) repeat protein